MKSTIATLAFSLCLLSMQVNAADAPNKPGPEQKKLEMGAGRWKSEGSAFESPFGPAGKVTGKGVSRMILGGFFAQNNWENINPKGVKTSSLEIIAYDPEKHLYQSTYFTSEGEFNKAWKGDNATCTIDGDTWHWSWVEEKNGKKYQCREVCIFAPDRKSFTFEGSYSEDGKLWIKRYSNKCTKIGDVKNE